jgi:exopolyphosphatase/guanosine-5'-triphosphate,3'-diphosphate pyrophosphatase
VLSGAEEARLTLTGVLSSVRADGLCLIVDIGGGSTELILSRDGLPLHTTSIRLGVVHLSEELLQNDPPSQPELLSLKSKIHDRLDLALAHDFSSALPALSPSSVSLIGTAGTITTLAAIDLKLTQYDPARITNHCLSRSAIEAIFHRLAGMRCDQRATVAGLEEGREDLIIPGTALLLTIMNRFGCETITVSDGGLLEGILIDAYRHPRTPDEPPHRSGFCLDSHE